MKLNTYGIAEVKDRGLLQNRIITWLPSYTEPSYAANSFNPWFVVCPLSAGSVGGGLALCLYQWRRVADWLRIWGGERQNNCGRRRTGGRLERDTETRRKYCSRGNVEVCEWRYAHARLKRVTYAVDCGNYKPCIAQLSAVMSLQMLAIQLKSNSVAPLAKFVIPNARNSTCTKWCFFCDQWPRLNDSNQPLFIGHQNFGRGAEARRQSSWSISAWFRY